MEQYSMGQMIAQLRKEQGMTQQEMAERLNVSNKAISRWEREESAPDLMLIPALADLLGISCDELLRGRRTEPNRVNEDPKENERLVRAQKGMSTLMLISLFLSMAGLMLMLAISFLTESRRADIGFAAMMLMILIASFVAVLGFVRAKEIVQRVAPHEERLKAFRQTSSCCLFHSVYGCFAAISIAVPLLLHFDFECWYMFLTLSGYLQILLSFVLWFLLFIYLEGKAICLKKINGNSVCLLLSDNGRKGNGWMLALEGVAAGCLFIAPRFSNWGEGFDLGDVLVLLGLMSILGAIVLFLLFVFREKKPRGGFLIQGSRNLLLLPSVVALSQSISASWIVKGDQRVYAGTISSGPIWNAACWAMMILALFSLFRVLMSNANTKSTKTPQ